MTDDLDVVARPSRAAHLRLAERLAAAMSATRDDRRLNLGAGDGTASFHGECIEARATMRCAYLPSPRRA